MEKRLDLNALFFQLLPVDKIGIISVIHVDKMLALDWMAMFVGLSE